ncbi:MAG: diphosphomevalonate decarboxylase [Deltaproteobacteria bacterium]|nr:MAG: diphosphomevalonate decarboxylase [Deltaproteobacteria bacterium]
MKAARAWAPVNVALVKYWGKQRLDENLPATGSLSLTLTELGTSTEVVFDPALDGDSLVLDGRPAPDAARQRVSAVLELVRQASGMGWFARVESRNTVPTASGLASSASAFAALVLAAWQASGARRDLSRLAELARRGSGSAPRSLLGGFVELQPPGSAGDGGWLRQLAPAEHWPLRLVVAVLAAGSKRPGSTEGMERSRLTSPYYQDWLATHPADMSRARQAVARRDLQQLGEVMESSCLKMHALTISSRPPFLYWRPATVAVLHQVWEWRRGGLPVFFTMDAGPHVKVLCNAGDARRVAEGLSQVPGVERVLVERPGAGARVVS